MIQRLWIFGALLFALSACATVTSSNSEADQEVSDSMPTHASQTPNLTDLGLAPEFTNEIWLNVEAPLRLADMRGKVVALDMWTFG